MKFKFNKKITKIILMIIIFIILVMFMTYHSFYFTNMNSLDEIWNFGFSKNIIDGFVPYKDFNMVITPLFPYINAIFLALFGKTLVVYHVFMAIIATTAVYIAYREIGWIAITIYVALLIYTGNGYNTFSLLLLFILLSLSKKQTKKNNILSAIIISMMILTKQTFALLVIPSLFHNKSKKQTFIVYIIIALLFIVSLICQENLLEFIDYCFLGMFDFAEKNVFAPKPYLIIEIIICLFLLFAVIKTKGKQKDVFYIFMYQIVAFPITDMNHLILAWVSVIYLVFKYKEKFALYQVYFAILSIIFHMLILGINDYNYTFKNKDFYENFKINSFLEGRMVPKVTPSYLVEMKEVRAQYEDYELYVLGNYAYLVKLFLEEPITKYDLINNGNLGYNGSKKYINEIKENCQEKKCLFIANTSELDITTYHQTNKDILRHATTYKNIKSTSTFSIYIS